MGQSLKTTFEKYFPRLKIWRGKPQILLTHCQSEALNFEMAQHIDKMFHLQ